jgi:ketosteroid isomerase-like protein
MTQENVAVVRRAWEAWERGDIEGLFALYDPEIVWDMSHYDDVIGGVFRGHEGVRRFFRQWLEPFETYRARAENFIDAGDNVVVEVRQGGRGKASKAEVEMPLSIGRSTGSEMATCPALSPTRSKPRRTKPPALQKTRRPLDPEHPR